MDSERFDRLTALVGTARSRRATLAALMAAAISSSLLTPASDAARKKLVGKKRCGRGKRKCGGKCVNTASNAQHCGSCGNACGAGQTCSGGVCSVCAPNCAGKQCGNDGCGGSCGTCGGSTTCSGGTCQCPGAGAACGSGCCATGQRCIDGACWADSEEQDCLARINQLRSSLGRPALTMQNQLGEAAEKHSRDQARNNFSSHNGSNGSTDVQRMNAAGFTGSAYAENIYWNSGDGSAAAAVAWWTSSSGHYANMTSTNLTLIGIGRAQAANGRWYWTTDFGKPV